MDPEASSSILGTLIVNWGRGKISVGGNYPQQQGGLQTSNTTFSLHQPFFTNAFRKQSARFAFNIALYKHTRLATYTHNYNFADLPGEHAPKSMLCKDPIEAFILLLGKICVDLAKAFEKDVTLL